MPQNIEPLFYVMINHEQSAGGYMTIEEARIEGRRMCDAESIPATCTIADPDGNQIESIEPTDGSSLSDQIAVFNRRHFKPRG